MGRLFKFFALAIIAGFSGALVTVLFHMGSIIPPVNESDVTYVDFLSITLTGLAVMITILGFFVAAAGVIGWTTLENKLRTHSLEYFKEQLGKKGDLRKEFEDLIVKVALAGIEDYKTSTKSDRDNGDKREEEYHD